MQTLYGQPLATRATTARTVKMMDRVLTANGVTRVRDLPEEARVRLFRQINAYFKRERDAAWERRINGGVFQRMRRWFQNSVETVCQKLET